MCCVNAIDKCKGFIDSYALRFKSLVMTFNQNRNTSFILISTRSEQREKNRPNEWIHLKYTRNMSKLTDWQFVVQISIKISRWSNVRKQWVALRYFVCAAHMFVSVQYFAVVVICSESQAPKSFSFSWSPQYSANESKIWFLEFIGYRRKRYSFFVVYLTVRIKFEKYHLRSRKKNVAIRVAFSPHSQKWVRRSRQERKQKQKQQYNERKSSLNHMSCTKCVNNIIFPYK